MAAIKKAKEQKSKGTKKTNSDLTVDIVDISGKKKGTIKLPKEYFGIPMNKALIAQAVRVYQTNQRQGGAKALTRGEVTGSGKKVWRQKGTGRARHGHRYAGLFVGGGKAHGPRPRVFEQTMNKKMKRKALATALSAQFTDNNIFIVDGLEKLEAKSNVLISTIGKITKNVKQSKLTEKILISTPEKAENVYRAGKNIENMTIREIALLNTYEVMNNRKIILSKKAIEMLGSKRNKSEVIPKK